MAAAAKTAEPRLPRGRALLLEHIPQLRFLHSSLGVLLLIYQNGEACFFPVNDQSKTPTSSVKLLTNAQKKLKDTPGATETQKAISASKYFAYDVAHVEHELCRIAQFNFHDEASGKPRLPRKILLSPDKRLLMLLGAFHQSHLSLVVHHIFDTPDYFKPIFHDLSLTFLDACFSPDSSSLAVIPSKSPHLIFIVQLPLDYSIRSTKPTSSSPSSVASESPRLSMQATKVISFEPRVVGPIQIVGPAKSVFGNHFRASRISAAMSYAAQVYVTWSEEGTGEYCLWSVPREPVEMAKGAAPGASTRLDYCCRLILGKGFDKSFFDNDENAKSFILDMQFSSDPSRLLAVVRRMRFSRMAENGIGLQMIKVDDLSTLGKADNESSDAGVWYCVREPEDKVDDKEVLAVKWTKTLLLGTAPAAACVVRSKGMFELVDYKYGSAFQALYDTFAQNVSNFVQIGDYRRFWVHTSGALGEIVVSPGAPSPHPEWRELFHKEPIDWNMRGLGRAVGYFINDVSRENPPVTAEQLQRGAKAKKPAAASTSLSVSTSDGKAAEALVQRFYGLHLYRCWYCKRTLLKPLQCGQCQNIAYCSKECQRDHWPTHKAQCASLPPTSKK